MTKKPRLSRKEYSLIGLGKVHAYTGYLVRQSLISEGAAEELCQRFYDGHPELKELHYREALDQAIKGRDEAFRTAKERLKENGS